MLGCESAAAARASRSKRERSALGASVLTATRRPSSSSSASQTELIGPRPSVSCRRYRPAIRSPAMRAIIVKSAWTTCRESMKRSTRCSRACSRSPPRRSRSLPLPAACWRRTRAPWSTCRRSPARRWTAMRCARRTRPAGCPSAASRPPARRSDALQSAGEAVVISTGAVVPEGADAVVPVEVTEREGDVVRVEAVSAGAHVRPRGGDARSGETIGSAGQLLGPTQVGALAAVGLASVVCARRPQVAVLATGSELRAPGETLGPGEIYESNTALIAAQVAVGRRRAGRARPGRRRRRRNARGARPRARVGRADHLGRRLGRPARPRPPRVAGARRGRGVLARRRQARQADRVRDARNDARLRPAGEPRLVARRLRALRAPRAARAAGCGPAAAGVSAGPRRGRPAAERRAGRAGAGARSRRAGGRRARAA